MALKASDTELTLTEIAGGIKAEKRRVAGGLSAVATGGSNLAGMTSMYGGFRAELTTMAEENPDDPAWQAFKAKMDLYVAEFVAAKNWVDLLVDAVDGIPEL